MNNKTKLKLLSWNVNGLRSVAQKGFRETMSMIDPDVICLQETKVKEDQLPQELLEFPGYHGYFFAAERPGYSGVAVYSKIEPNSVRYGIGEDKYDREGRVLILDYDAFQLINAYFPNGGSGEERLNYKLEFCQAISTYCKESKRPILLCGDVNTAHREIDLARPKENVNHSGFMPIERQWIDEFLDLGFLDTFRLFCQEEHNYSWWDMKTRARGRNVGWRIDYFFASQSLKDALTDAFIIPEVLGSDHCPVGICLEV